MIKIKGTKRSGTNLLRYLLNNYSDAIVFGNNEYGGKHKIEKHYEDINYLCIMKNPLARIYSMIDYENNWKNKDVDFMDKQILGEYLKDYRIKYSIWLSRGYKILIFEDLLENLDLIFDDICEYFDLKKFGIPKFPKKRIKPSGESLNFFSNSPYYPKNYDDYLNRLKKKENIDLINYSEAMKLYIYINKLQENE